MLRGVAFELRVKAEGWHRELWNWLFWAGSTLAAFAQGLMLGRYVTGFAAGGGYWLVALVVGARLCGRLRLPGAARLPPPPRRGAAGQTTALGGWGVRLVWRGGSLAARRT